MFKRFLARIGCNVEKTPSVYETIDSKDEDISILCKDTNRNAFESSYD